MNSKLLIYVDCIINDRLRLLEKRKTNKSWKNKKEYFSSLGLLNIEEEIKLCNKFLNESLKLQNIGDI
tara:strand:- start:173 stop:376 length:204 start_codon:yes stop_codon:yes gene_type:complete